jgi:hypothetical protein
LPKSEGEAKTTANGVPAISGRYGKHHGSSFVRKYPPSLAVHFLRQKPKPTDTIFLRSHYEVGGIFPACVSRLQSVVKRRVASWNKVFKERASNTEPL